MNTYALFSELARRLLAPEGRAGIIVPTGIATDDTTKLFFGDLIESETLAQLLGFVLPLQRKNQALPERLCSQQSDISE